jgi:hypothetical protein
MASLVDAESILVIEVGSIFTRAILFDIVDGRYRFIAKGTAKSTAFAPYRNVGEGVRSAIDQLQNITGRRLVDSNQNLIIPTAGDGNGVDRLAASISVGEPLRTVTISLLDEISGDSARRLAETTYCDVLHNLSLNDRRKPEARLNLIVQSRPDLIIVAGGTNGGASQSVMSLLETIGLACYLLPETKRPEVLFVGNQDLSTEARATLEGLAEVHCADNIRPTLELESLENARSMLGNLYTEHRVKNLPGMDALRAWAGEGLLPNATAFSRVVRFLSAILKERKGVIGIDIGASAVAVAAAVEGDSSLSVYPRPGLLAGAANLYDLTDEKSIMRWLMMDIPPKMVHGYLLNKLIHPGTIPASEEELEIEHAITRFIIHESVQLARTGFPKRLPALADAFLPFFEPILATGSVLARAPGPAYSALLLLDSLQPIGISTLVLDQNQIASAIGSAALFNPLLAVQVMDSNSFLNVGTVIAPIVNVKSGLPVLRIKLTYESGHETDTVITKGAFEVLPVPYGHTARLMLQPLHRADIGMGAPGRGGSLTVKGGILGVIVDARGRPLVFSKDLQKRQEDYRKWLWTLGGQ